MGGPDPLKFADVHPPDFADKNKVTADVAALSIGPVSAGGFVW